MTAELRAARDALVVDRALAGREFGAALSDALDDALRAGASSLARPPGSWALVAMGSYACRELCPASDVDVMLLLGRGGDAKPDDAAALWYPLWDSGFVLGQSERTLKEALALADSDLQSMTALLDVRLLAGDAALAADLEQRVRALVPRRRERLLDQLAAASSARMTRPGPIAEMLEPNVKDGSGGLRDIQAAGWLGWTLTSGATTPALDGRSWEAGTTTLVDLGYLLAADRDRLAAGRDRLLESRVALHRVTRGRGDQLSLQDQDEVAALVGAPDADQLVRSLGEASRTVAWIVADLFVRLRDAARVRVIGPSACERSATA